MIIDAHAHLWGKGFVPNDFYLSTAEEWAGKSPDRKPEMIMPKLVSGIVDEDGGLFLENMDQAGVDVTIVNMTDFGVHWSGAEPETGWEAQLAYYRDMSIKYPGRLFFFAFFDPRRTDHLDLMTKAAEQYGCCGCGEISPHGFKVSDDIMQPLFRKCVDLDLPVFIHTRTGHGTAMKGNDYTVNNDSHPFHIKHLQTKYPELVVLVGHAGYDLWWAEAARIARGHPNCYLELSDWDLELSDTGNLIAKLAGMRDLVGADHMIFGSDQPSGPRFCKDKSPLPAWVDFFKNLPETAGEYGYQLTKAEVELIMGENARRIFKLETPKKGED